jgi:hypothetical protein
MKSVAAGTTSGCLVWVLVFAVVSLCLCPVAAVIGGLTSTLQADFVAGVLGPYLCPVNSTAEIITFQTTMSDGPGDERLATGFEMQCVDATGRIVRAPSPDYAFYWVGLLAVGGLGIAVLLALLLAAPAGALIARFTGHSQQGFKT